MNCVFVSSLFYFVMFYYVLLIKGLENWFGDLNGWVIFFVMEKLLYESFNIIEGFFNCWGFLLNKVEKWIIDEGDRVG